MIKLRFEKPEFKTYCNGRITTCTYKCTLYETENKSVLEKFTVSGKATCADDDVCDPEIGRSLSNARAKRNAYKKAKSHLMSFHTLKELRLHLKHISERWRALQTLVFCYDDEVEHIKRLLKHESHV